MDKRTQNIIKNFADHGAGMKYTKGDLEDLLEAFVKAQNCDHDCLNTCSDDGCNCDCGEWHISEE